MLVSYSLDLKAEKAPKSKKKKQFIKTKAILEAIPLS